MSWVTALALTLDRNRIGPEPCPKPQGIGVLEDAGKGDACALTNPLSLNGSREDEAHEDSGEDTQWVESAGSLSIRAP